VHGTRPRLGQLKATRYDLTPARVLSRVDDRRTPTTTLKIYTRRQCGRSAGQCAEGCKYWPSSSATPLPPIDLRYVTVFSGRLGTGRCMFSSTHRLATAFCSTSNIDSRALSFSDHYCQSTCRNAILSVIVCSQFL